MIKFAESVAGIYRDLFKVNIVYSFFKRKYAQF